MIEVDVVLEDVVDALGDLLRDQRSGHPKRLLPLPPLVPLSDLREVLDRADRGVTEGQLQVSVAVLATTVAVPVGGVAPTAGIRSPLRLSRAEREEISRCVAAGDSLCAVARRPRASKLARSPRLRIVVERWLARRWSPPQIAHHLPLTYPADSSMRVSHETIYRSLFVQARGALRRELTRYLRTGRTQRRARTRPTRTGRLRDLVLLADRPADAADRAVPGHWEGDWILGRAGRSAIGSVVERRSRYVLLLRLPHGRTADQVRRVLAARMTTLSVQLRRALTWDQGKEMAEHVQFRVETAIPIYFCDPRSPWQRPTSENTNGLLRQYFPQTHGPEQLHPSGTGCGRS